MGKIREKPTVYGITRDIAHGLGERIGVVADQIGSRKEAAAAGGITVGSLQRYIADVNIPGFDVCARLCATAGVRMEWLAFDVPPMSVGESSQPARLHAAELDTGMLAVAVRITDEVLRKYDLRDALTSTQFADLTRIVLNDLARGAADDAALASLDRVLAINRKP